jgi:hypothetical protein
MSYEYLFAFFIFTLTCSSAKGIVEEYDISVKNPLNKTIYFNMTSTELQNSVSAVLPQLHDGTKLEPNKVLPVNIRLSIDADTLQKLKESGQDVAIVKIFASSCNINDLSLVGSFVFRCAKGLSVPYIEYLDEGDQIHLEREKRKGGGTGSVYKFFERTIESSGPVIE